jgi:uncharacterized protein (DUF58 family)
MPASRVFVAAGLATLIVALSTASPRMAVGALVLDAATILAFLLDRRRAANLPLSASRVWPALLVQGVEAGVEVRFSAPRGLVVLAREALHPALAEKPLRQRMHLVAGAETSWRYPLTPRRRGEHDVGPLTVRVLGPWGLAWAQRDLLPKERRRVYPQVRWEGRVGRLLALAHRNELGQAPLRVHGGGTESYALREYRPGDPPNRIQWKVSARHQRLVSREEAWERGRRLVVLLDCARTMASMDGGRSKLDHALAAALALTRVAASRGDRVTLLAFSDRVERLVRVRGGHHAVSRAYAALFDLEARLVEPSYDLAVEAVSSSEPRRAVVVLLTSVIDLVAAEVLREAVLTLRRRHRPILINLEDPELLHMAVGVPETTEEAFAKVSSLGILLANRSLGRRLRRSGVSFAVTSADQLAGKTLETYLHLFERRGPPTGRVGPPQSVTGTVS